MRSKLVLPIVIIVGALVVAVALIKTKPEAKPVEVKEKSWLVNMQVAEPKRWAPRVTLYGRVESLWSSTLTAGVTADVLAVEVIEGDKVDAGQVLVRLDERDARLQLSQREADLMEAEARIDAERTNNATDKANLPREQRLLSLANAEVKRLTNLVRKKLASQSQLDTARQAAERQAITVAQRKATIRQFAAKLAELKARKARAEALRDQAALELERCQIKAPFAGRITAVRVAHGKRVRTGDALIELFDSNALVLRAQIPTRFLPTVNAARADSNKLAVSGKLDGSEVRARLLRLSGAVANASGGVEALFKLEQGPDTLQQGRFVRLQLVLPEQEGLIAVPHGAVYGADRVYRLDKDQRMRPLRVQRIGETRNAAGQPLLLISSNKLRPGDRLVTTQLPNAIDGLQVRLPGQLPAKGKAEPKMGEE